MGLAIEDMFCRIQTTGKPDGSIGMYGMLMTGRRRGGSKGVEVSDKKEAGFGSSFRECKSRIYSSQDITEMRDVGTLYTC